MTTFEHGGDVTVFAKACDCEASEVIDLSSNINFIKPPIDIDFNALDIAPYPNYETLYESIASHYGVHVEEIELFNGGSSAIFSLFSHIKGTVATAPYASIYSPAYLEYKKAAGIFGYAIEHIERFEAFDTEVKEDSLVVFVNPSTPDGMFYDIIPLLKKWQEKNCTVLVDESFIEFTTKSSVTQYLIEYPNLYILKSMTKFFGAAGIRMGTLISQANNIDKLKAREPLWKLSAFDAAYIESVLQDSQFKEISDASNKEAKQYLTKMLQNTKEVEYIYPSFANYILVKLNITAKAFQKKLIPHNIMIRDCSNFDGLDKHHVRIAIKSITELTKLKEALHV